MGGALGFAGERPVSKPGDGSASGRWPEFAERDLFAHVAHLCYLDYKNGEAVKVSRVLRTLAAKGFPLRRMDYEPRSKVEAAMAARKAGDVLAVVNAIKSGEIRQRRRAYLTKSVGPLRDAFYRVLGRLKTETAQPGAYRRKCLASVAGVAGDWSADRALAQAILAFTLDRPDQAEE